MNNIQLLPVCTVWSIPPGSMAKMAVFYYELISSKSYDYMHLPHKRSTSPFWQFLIKRGQRVWWGWSYFNQMLCVCLCSRIAAFYEVVVPTLQAQWHTQKHGMTKWVRPSVTWAHTHTHTHTHTYHAWMNDSPYIHTCHLTVAISYQVYDMFTLPPPQHGPYEGSF